MKLLQFVGEVVVLALAFVVLLYVLPLLVLR